MKKTDKAAKQFFTDNLLAWNKYQNKREMPWKFEKDPYRIWISEIILQQTRVNQGLGYYNRFIQRYPNIKSLAKAPEGDVFKMWEGLGYYSRCKNIIHTARHLQTDLGGRFPEKFEQILALKGIGTYTASAIASFAYNLPYAVLDGNVFRVLSRYFGITLPIDGPRNKKFFADLAYELLDKNIPGIYNQGLMDLGATICKPVPVCEICPLQSKCIAYLKNVQLHLPVKEKRLIKKERWLYYLVVNWENKFYVKKREQKDIWQNLHEFILVETGSHFPLKKLMVSTAFRSVIGNNEFTIEKISKLHKQQLTHQVINGQFIDIKVNCPLPVVGYQLLTAENIKQLPFPKFIAAYLKD